MTQIPAVQPASSWVFDGSGDSNRARPLASHIPRVREVHPPMSSSGSDNGTQNSAHGDGGGVNIRHEGSYMMFMQKESHASWPCTVMRVPRPPGRQEVPHTQTMPGQGMALQPRVGLHTRLQRSTLDRLHQGPLHSADLEGLWANLASHSLL